MTAHHSRPAASDLGLKTRYEREAAALRCEPSRAAHRATAHVRVAYGLACEVEHADRTLRVDLPGDEGGTASGPHPGQLMRASLGACLVMGYRLWAARLGIALDDVSLDIECEYDARGQLGLDADVQVGWQRVRIDVVLYGSAPEAELLRLAEHTHRLSPMLANLSPDVERVFRVRVAKPERFVPAMVTPSK